MENFKERESSLITTRSSYEGQRPGRGWASLCAALLILGTLAACSDNKTANSGSSAASSAAAKPTGEPIVIGTVSQDDGASLTPQGADGLEAWAFNVNNASGIGGRPVAIHRCSDGGDTAKHQQCVRDFIADPKVVVAIPGNARNTGTVGAPLYAEAKLPFICMLPQQAETNSPVSFCTTGGTPTHFAAMVGFFADKGAKKFAFAFIDSSGGQAANTLTKTLVDGIGGTLTSVPIPIGSPDFLPAATAVTAVKPDVILIGTATNDTVSLLKALQTLGNTAPIAVGGISLTPEGITSAGAAAEGIHVTANFLPVEEDPNGPALIAGLKGIGRDSSVGDSALSGYAAGVAFESIANAVLAKGSLTRESVLNYIRTTPVRGAKGLPDSLQLDPNAPLGLTSVANRTLFIQIVKNGKLVRESDRVDPFKSSSTQSSTGN